MATENKAASTSVQALLIALQHGDSAFPSGGFAFSQGLEGLASTLARRPSGEDVSAFVAEQVRHRWASADRVALARAFRAGDDMEAVAEIDRDLDRSTLCASLRDGTARNGQALLSAHVRLATPGAALYREMVASGQAPGTLGVVQAVVWRGAGIGEAQAELLSGYGLVSSSLASAVRLGLVGAIGAQALMARLLGIVADCTSHPVPFDAEITGFSPLCEIAAMHQASLPLRLFSN